MTSDEPTREQVARAQAGDRDAYERLFARVAERLLVYVRCRMGPALAARLDPMDVLQETFVEAHRSFSSFVDAGPGSFTRWLYGVAEHRLQRLAEHYAAQKRRPPGPSVRASQVMEVLAAQETGLSTAFDRQTENARLVAAVDELDPDEREAILRRHFRGDTLEAIAAHLGRSERSVRRLLGQAQRRLGALLREGASEANGGSPGTSAGPRGR